MVHWGYTIYRTYYGRGSNEKWSKLLENITDGVENCLHELEGAEDEPDDVTKMIDQFRLDAHSLPATLDRLIMEDVQQVYLNGSGGQPMRGIQSDSWGTCVFLLADTEVLRDPNPPLIKSRGHEVRSC